jgi:Tannase and feruloyl esterase
MMHCGAGPGANLFGNFLDPLPSSDPEHNIFLSLQQWVEKGVSPDTLIATRNVNDDPAKPVEMTRPLCAYPAVATWKGSGDPNQAVNWRCMKQSSFGTTSRSWAKESASLQRGLRHAHSSPPARKLWSSGIVINANKAAGPLKNQP